MLNKDKVSVCEKIYYGLGDTANSIIWTTIATYLLFFYTDIFGISGKVASGLFLVARIWDAINDILFGYVIDRGKTTKFGKYKKWLLYMVLPFSIVSVLCFTTPDIPYIWKIVYAYITYISLGMIMTFISIPYGALGSLMTNDPHEQTSIAAYRMTFALVGDFICILGIPFFMNYFGEGNNARGIQITIFSMVILSSILILITVFGVRETVSVNNSDKLKFREIINQIRVNKPLRIVSLIFCVYYGVLAIGNSSGVFLIKYVLNKPDLIGIYGVLSISAQMLLIPIMPFLAKKYGKKKIMILSVCINICGYMAIFITSIFKFSFVFVFLSRFIVGVGGAGIMGLMWSLIPEVIAHGTKNFEKQINGSAYAIVGFAFKLGGALGGIVPGVVLDYSGYIANQSQSVSAQIGIIALCSMIPATIALFNLPLLKNYFKEIEVRR